MQGHIGTVHEKNKKNQENFEYENDICILERPAPQFWQRKTGNAQKVSTHKEHKGPEKGQHRKYLDKTDDKRIKGAQVRKEEAMMARQTIKEDFQEF